MADIGGTIEALELRFMQSWMRGDEAAVRKLIARDCMMVFGTNPPELLDRASFTAALARDFRCTGYRMGKGIVRKYGRTVWHSASAEVEMKLGAREWSGRFTTISLWRKHRIGGWKLVERSVSPIDQDEQLGAKLRKLQLWH